MNLDGNLIKEILSVSICMLVSFPYVLRVGKPNHFLSTEVIHNYFYIYEQYIGFYQYEHHK